MKVQFYYTRDKDGRADISFRVRGENVPPHKDIEFNQWRSPDGDTDYRWIKVSDLDDYDKDTIYPLIKEALETIPEPSWEDEVPMLVTLDIQCTNINYSYVE